MAAATHVWVAVGQQKGLGDAAALVLRRRAGRAGVGRVLGERQPRLLGRARRREAVGRAVWRRRPRVVFNGCHCACAWSGKKLWKLAAGIFGPHVSESRRPHIGALALVLPLAGWAPHTAPTTTVICGEACTFPVSTSAATARITCQMQLNTCREGHHFFHVCT